MYTILLSLFAVLLLAYAKPLHNVEYDQNDANSLLMAQIQLLEKLVEGAQQRDLKILSELAVITREIRTIRPSIFHELLITLFQALPPCLVIYCVVLAFRWLKSNGSLLLTVASGMFNGGQVQSSVQGQVNPGPSPFVADMSYD
jgi:hypothetical protein